MIGGHRRPRGPVRRFAAAGLVLSAALVGPAIRDARAFIQYQVTMNQTGLPTGVKISWNRSCVDITAYPADLSEMTFDQVTQAARQRRRPGARPPCPAPIWISRSPHRPSRSEQPERTPTTS